MSDMCEIIRLPRVLALRGRSRSAHYEDIKLGLFPPAVRIGFRAVGWPVDEVQNINAARIAGKTNAEVRGLVQALVKKRKSILSNTESQN